MNNDFRQLHLRGALGAVRTETFDGREHLVVPVVALMEGVIHAVNASTPERVPASTLAKAAHTWNGRPLVFGHPIRDGKQCSANDARVLEQYAFGTIFNARMQGTKLLMDAYVDPVRAEKIGGAKFLERLKDASDRCEVSVGAHVVTDTLAGTHLGKPYKASWLESTGDHLAFLPNGKGACSVEMGCGSNRAAMHLVTAEAIEVDTELRACIIKRVGSKWVLYTGDGSKVLGRHDTEAGAKAQESAIEISKHRAAEKDEHGYGSDAKPHSTPKNETEHAQNGHAGAPNPGIKNSVNWAAHEIGRQMAKDGKPAPKSVKQSRGYTMKVDGAIVPWPKDSPKGLSMKSIKERILALFDTPEQAASEEAAELIAYRSMRTLMDAVGDQWDAASSLIDDLIADEEESPTVTPAQEIAEEEVEDARLDAVRVHCYTMIAALQSVCNACSDQQIPDAPSVSDPRYGEAVAALARSSRRWHTNADKATVQAAHDASHDTHAHTVALGAQCNGMKLLNTQPEAATGTPELKAACSCEGENMTTEQRAAALKVITEIKDAKYTEEEVKALGHLSDKRVSELHALASMKPEDCVKFAKEAADAVMSGLNASKPAEVKTAELKAAEIKIAEQKTAEQKTPAQQEEEYLKTAPESIRVLVAKQKAQDASRKAELVTALKGGPLSEEQLKAKSTEELETLAAYAKVETVDYSGRGTPRSAQESDVYANPPDGYAEALKARKAVN